MSKLKLLAVTKNRSVEEIQALLEKTGITRCGENRLKEAEQKIPKLPEALEWHFIGKLQSRKIPHIVEMFDVIQSVESSEQARKISNCGKAISVFLQVNISGRSGRSGAMPEQVPELIQVIRVLPNLELRGLMGMASPLSEVGEEQVRREFKLLKSLQGELPECSMGMSGDWPLALECGSTLLRLGSALFQDPLPDLPKFE